VRCFVFPEVGGGIGGFFFLVMLRRVPVQSSRPVCIAVVVAVHDGELGEGWVAGMLFGLGWVYLPSRSCRWEDIGCCCCLFQHFRVVVVETFVIVLGASRSAVMVDD
jgi:hypothetical protein